MNVLLKDVTIVDDRSSWKGKKVSVGIENGIIKEIGNISGTYDRVLEGQELMLSVGWFDMRTTMGEPGTEHKEDLETASMAAARGGFTGIACMPNTKPAIQTKDAVAYLRSRTAQALVSAYPVASVTLNNQGKDLTEMIDLHHAGAVAFSDGDQPIWHTDVLLKSLQYVQMFDGLVINHAEDHLLTYGAQMNESEVSTRLGFKGFPYLAEELMVARDLRILEYTGGRIHFATISSPGSLELIKNAKKNGLQVTCDMAAYQLAFDEEHVQGFDTNYKVNPPLRTKADIQQFWKYIYEGVVDILVTDHIPQDTESKKLEFDLAEFGMNSLETFFPMLLASCDDQTFLTLLPKFTRAPRTLLKLEQPEIEIGKTADLTLFSCVDEWEVKPSEMRSRSLNTPLLGTKVKGKIKAVFHNQKLETF
ncbi:MAG: dihydroorotase [Cytophagaceae bacterium]|jgi:dihydroorotase|nr:dihydroorotase [Cytophagaceae bacterium]